MTDYRQSYIKRNIPAFTPAYCSPYKRDKMPRQGWWWIEPCGESDLPHPRQGDRKQEDREIVRELIDEECLAWLCGNFDPSANGGNGELINKDHLARISGNETKADGWIRALDWGVNPATNKPMLAAYLSLTPDGYNNVLNYYWAWSTEYLMSEYVDRGNSKWSPTRLRGLAPTNIPDHPDQTGTIIPTSPAAGYIVHSAGLAIHLPNTNQPTTNNNMANRPNKFARVLHSDGAGDPEKTKQDTDTITNSDDNRQTQDDLNTNAEDQRDNGDVNCNSDSGWVDIADQVAAALNLGDEASGDEIVEAVKALKADYDTLKAAASASETQTHSARRPRMIHSQGAVRMDRKVAPDEGKAVKTPDGKTIKATQDEIDLVAHCRKAVDSRTAILHRQLTPGEFNDTWSTASREYGNNH